MRQRSKERTASSYGKAVDKIVNEGLSKMMSVSGSDLNFTIPLEFSTVSVVKCLLWIVSYRVIVKNGKDLNS